MTTNESQKWADWRDDIADGLAYRAKRSQLQTHNHLRRYGGGRSGNPALDAGADDEPKVHWPLSSDQVLVATRDARPPRGQEGLWTKVERLGEVENIYDLGGWENFKEMLRGR